MSVKEVGCYFTRVYNKQNAVNLGTVKCLLPLQLLINNTKC